jgi:hypothetical protein
LSNLTYVCTAPTVSSPLRELSGISSQDCLQGCQMAYFQTKNPNLGKFWSVCKLYGHLVYTYNFHFVYFMAVWLILWTIWYIFPVLVCCTKKNLATLIASQNLLPSSSSQPNQLFLRNLIVKSCQGVRPTLKLLSLPRISFTSPMQGCQIFICSKLPKRQKYNK